jgi:hypothetical protein
MKKKAGKELDEAKLASVNKELAKPRMARSACKEEVNLNTARISEHASHHARNRRQNHPVSASGQTGKSTDCR